MNDIRPDGYQIRPGLVIPTSEVWFEFSHSGGPGGQNVNKVATAATLCFHPDSSSALHARQKELVKNKLKNRINVDGILKITAEDARSQSANRTLAARRFMALLEEALRPVKIRRPTRPSRAAKERRLTEKRSQAMRKAARRRLDSDDF
ncbi:MAG: aminoacyl-tRNA hydrolase [Planctomycetes bacterium]|nr:aminoacyl-tRNA hydrolase [Planctomycetota bacterium]